MADAGWTPPPPDECEEYVYDAAVGELGDVLRVRQTRDLRDNLIDFAIIQMTPLDGRLRRVAVADMCHSELHVHVFNQQEEKIHRESIRPIVTQKDVDEGYDAGPERIEEMWEDYKRRWQRG